MPKINHYSPDRLASPLVGVASRNPEGGALREYSKDLRGTEEELNQLANAQAVGEEQIAGATERGIVNIADALAYHSRVKNAQNIMLARNNGTAQNTKLSDDLDAAYQKAQEDNPGDPDGVLKQFTPILNSKSEALMQNFPDTLPPFVVGGVTTGNPAYRNPTVIQEFTDKVHHTVAQFALKAQHDNYEGNTALTHLANDTAITTGQNQIADNPSTDINQIISKHIATVRDVKRTIKDSARAAAMGYDQTQIKSEEADHKLSNETATHMVNTLFGKDPVDGLHAVKMLQGGIIENKGFNGIQPPLDLTDKDKEHYGERLKGFENSFLGELVTDAKVKEAGATAEAGTFKLNAAKNQRNDAVLTNIASDTQKKIDKTNIEITNVENDDTILPKVKQAYITGLVAQRGQYETAYEKTQSYMAENARILRGEAVTEAREAKKIKADDHRAALGEIHNGVNQLSQIASGNLGENADQIQEYALAQVQQINAAQTANKISPDEAQKYIKEYASLIKASAVYTKSDPGVLSYFGVKSEVVKQTGEDASKAQQAALNQFYTSMNKLQGMVSQTQININDFNMSPEQNAAYQRNVTDAEKVIGGPLNPKQQAAMRTKALKDVPSTSDNFAPLVKPTAKELREGVKILKTPIGNIPAPPKFTPLIAEQAKEGE